MDAPFKRMRRIGGLRSFGLSITRAIVEAHDGTIGFTSEEGVGTTFLIQLPPAVAARAVA